MHTAPSETRGRARVGRGPTAAGRGITLLIAAGVSLMLLASTAAAQGGSVGGTVVSQQSMRPLAGAQVLVEGTGRGTLTDAGGRFLITGLTGPGVQLTVSMIGYRSTTRAANVGATDIQVALSESAIELDAVVVTGTPGATQQRSVGNAIATVEAAEVNMIAQPANIQEMIGSRVAGMNIMRGSGEVGAGAATAIRGVGSLALSHEPLLYIDGVRVSNDASFSGSAFWSSSGGASRINDLNPNDIESIEVIKGPAAATLYGTEASNGVIQIITKKGAAGETEWTVEVEQGANFLPNASEVYPTVWGRDESGLISLNIIENDIATGFGSPFSTGHVQRYSAQARGGAEGLRFFVSGTAGREEGIVDYNWQNNVSLRSNVQYDVGSTLDLGMNLGIVRQSTRAASAWQPITTHIIWGLPVLKDTPRRGYLVNVPEDFEDVEGLAAVMRSTIGVNAEHRPLEWFTHRLTVGGDFDGNRSTLLIPRSAEQPGPFGNRSRGLREVTNQRSEIVTADYSATAAFELTGALGSATSAGVQFFRKAIEIDQTEGQVFPIPGIETVSGAATRFAVEDFLENRTMGVFFQEQISWRDRVFLTGAVRGDDNSAFGQNYEFVVYPKLSASWILSEEPVFDPVQGVVSTLKLRGAWGRAGQQPDVFAAARLYRPETGDGGVSTVTPLNIGNPDLKPEVGEELELGFDAGLFDDRVGVEFTFYDQTTNDAIIPRPVRPSFGFPGEQFVNVGEIRNRGTELLVNANVLQSRNLDWDLSFTYATNENEVIDLGGIDLPPSVVGQRHLPGYALGSIFLKKVVSAEYDADGNLANVLCEGGDPVTGGGPAVPCSEAGTAYFGQPIPRWQGNAASTLRLWDNLTLYGQVDFVGGHQRINADIAASHIFFRNSRCINERPICDPVLAAYDQMAQWIQSGITDGGFAKLRTLSATYAIPPRLTRSVGASRASFTLAGHNVARLWTAQAGVFGHTGTDPEIRSQSSLLVGYNQERWPQSTSVTASLRLTF